MHMLWIQSFVVCVANILSHCVNLVRHPLYIFRSTEFLLMELNLSTFYFSLPWDHENLLIILASVFYNMNFIISY